MNDDLERMVIGVRADTGGFLRDVEAMRVGLEDGLGSAAERAGGAIERGLLRAVRSGKFGFEDLRRMALSVMGDIAAAAVKSGIGAILGGGGGGAGGGGLIGAGVSVLGGALGLPGRATGGPVAPGVAYRVGERGPEMFVPTASGRVLANEGAAGGRDVRVSIRVDGGSGGDAPRALARSARQVARAVRGALEA